MDLSCHIFLWLSPSGVLKSTLAWLQSHHISLKIKLDPTVACNEDLRG